MILSLCLLPFLLIVPVLEINETHVFNSAWPSHARLHEVWQLVTNFAIGLFCLWLAWRAGKVRAAALLALTATGGFLIAYVLRASYGGSMRHTDGTELMVAGINSSMLVMLIASIVLAALAWSSDGRNV